MTQSSTLIPSLAVGKHPAKKCLSICRGGNWHSDRLSQEHVLTQLWTKPGLPNYSPVLTQKENSKLTGFCGTAEERSTYLRVPKEKGHFSYCDPAGSPGHPEQTYAARRLCAAAGVSLGEQRVEFSVM